jgi:hypothetical protein
MDVSRLEARRKTASGREEGKEGGREEGREEGREGGRRRTQKDEGGGGYIRQVLLGASIKQVHYFQEDKPLCLVPHRRYDELVQVGREGGGEGGREGGREGRREESLRGEVYLLSLSTFFPVYLASLMQACH